MESQGPGAGGVARIQGRGHGLCRPGRVARGRLQEGENSDGLGGSGYMGRKAGHGQVDE